jgi:hypothetical protein
MKSRPKSGERFAGLDLAPNHAACVVIDLAGRIQDYAFVTDSEYIANCWPLQATYLDVKGLRDKAFKKDKPAWKHHRHMFMADWLAELSRGMLQTVDLGGIEDYKFGRGTNNAYQIAEVGGAARRSLALAEIPFLLIGIRAIKSYARISGKEKPIAFCNDQLGSDWSMFDTAKQNSDTPSDLADAHVIAAMTRDAYRVRAGESPKTFHKSIKALAKREPFIWS